MFKIEGVQGHINEEIINAVIIGKNVLKRMLGNAGLAGESSLPIEKPAELPGPMIVDGPRQGQGQQMVVVSGDGTVVSQIGLPVGLPVGPPIKMPLPMGMGIGPGGQPAYVAMNGARPMIVQNQNPKMQPPQSVQNGNLTTEPNCDLGIAGPGQAKTVNLVEKIDDEDYDDEFVSGLDAKKPIAETDAPPPQAA